MSRSRAIRAGIGVNNKSALVALKVHLYSYNNRRNLTHGVAPLLPANLFNYTPSTLFTQHCAVYNETTTRQSPDTYAIH
jgi:hypothetical protein